LLGELDDDYAWVVADLEAGVGTVLRMAEGLADAVIVVCEPTTKSIEMSRRAGEIAAERGCRVIVVANRLTDEADLELVTAALPGYEIVGVPDEPVIQEADRRGVAPVDLDPEAPGVARISTLAEVLSRRDRSSAPSFGE
jgi:CO dehydrogenase maturation factor